MVPRVDKGEEAGIDVFLSLREVPAKGVELLASQDGKEWTVMRILPAAPCDGGRLRLVLPPLPDIGTRVFEIEKYGCARVDEHAGLSTPVRLTYGRREG